MNQKRKKEIVVITGASAGVGRATAIAFANTGSDIGLISRDMKALESIKREVESRGVKAFAAVADVADAVALESAAAKIEQELGPIDIWVNNAMTTVFSEFMDITPEDYKRVTDVTYHGFVNGTRSALKRMIPRNRGVIIQAGSALAYRGIPLQTAYCGAKHAIEGFTESLRSELIRNKVKVHMSMVQLPALNTPQFKWCKSNMPGKPMPVPPIYQPEVAARAIIYAARHRQREVFVGFRNSIIVWGNKFFPALGDLYLAKKGFDSQMTNEPEDKSRPFNLWEPVEIDYGTYGDFGHMSKKRAFITTTIQNTIIIISLAVVFFVLLGFTLIKVFF